MEFAAARSLRILVVDDNVDAADMLVDAAGGLGHQVVGRARRGAAPGAGAGGAADVCLLDIGLPEMDGNELAQRLRAQPETASAVLIAVTGYGQEQDRRGSLTAGFDEHLRQTRENRQAGGDSRRDGQCARALRGVPF